MPRNSAPFEIPSTPSSARLSHRLLIALLVLVFALAAGYGALVLVTRIDEVFFPGNGLKLGVELPGIDSGEGENVGRDRINILVMGLDLRPREGEVPSRSDTMFVLTVDPRSKTAGILGIPRDLYVEIPDGAGSYYEDRINTAFILGEMDEEGGGKRRAIATVENLLGIEVHHYVIIDFEGFEALIDALGGIEVDVPTLIGDYYYSETELPGDYWAVEFEPGLQHMDGAEALAYSRIREGYCEPYPCNIDDLDRIQRQQRVTFAVMDKALSMGVLDNAKELWDKYKDTIDTDISDFQIGGYALLAKDISPERISALSLGPATTPWTTDAGAEVLLPSPEGVQRIVQALFSDQQLLEEMAVVEVQDRTHEEEDMGVAVVNMLANLGFPEQTLISYLPTDGNYQDQTAIIDFSGQEKSYTLQKLAEWLNVPPTSVRPATTADAALRSTEADILVLLGADLDLAALNAPSSSE